MSSRSHRFRHVILGALVAIGVLLATLHLSYPLPYVYRVFAYRDSGFEDIHHFPARRIAASDAPSELPVALDPVVAAVFERHPEIDDFGAFLEESETTAFLVAHQGLLVVEEYLRGHDRETPQNTFSVSKSVMSALVGLAERNGVLELGAPITRYLPELEARDERFAAITVENLLDMRSGIRYSSDVDFPFVNQDDPLIYYSLDLESIVLGRTTVDAPPGDFRYNNYNPPLIGLILRRTTGVPAAEYLGRELWQPLGAEGPAGWTTDNQGLERMESGFHARGRDLLRFGLMFLGRGTFDGRRVLPQAWVLESTEWREPEVLERYNGRSWDYTAGWWIVPRPEGPADFCAIGRYGQFIYVSPQHDVVFVRNGPGRGEWGDFDWTELFYSTAELMRNRSGRRTK